MIDSRQLKLRTCLDKKKPPFLRIVVIILFFEKSSVKHQSQKFAHHSKTNKNKRNYGTPYLNEYTNESNCSTYSEEFNEKIKSLFHNLLFFYFIYKVIAFFINYCNLENSEYCMNLISCGLPPRTIS